MPKLGDKIHGCWFECLVCRKAFWRVNAWLRKSGNPKTCSLECRKRFLSGIIGQEDEILSDYRSGSSLTRLCESYRSDNKTLRDFLVRNGEFVRPNGFYQEGSRNKNWKGGHITKEGYRRIGHRFEHRIVMEQIIGRKLLRNEHVHHLNGIKLDNRPENLALHSPHAHGELHAKQFRDLQEMYYARIRFLEHRLQSIGQQ
jgi:hypothetical protein